MTTTVRQLPAPLHLETATGEPFALTLTATGATVTAAAVTLYTSPNVVTTVAAPTVTVVANVITVTFTAADMTALYALGTAYKAALQYRITGTVGGTPFSLVAGSLTVWNAGQPGVSTSLAASLAVTVGSTSTALTVALGGASPTALLAQLLTVDGAGSGLDADFLDGQSSAYFGTAASVATNTTNIATNTAAIAALPATYSPKLRGVVTVSPVGISTGYPSNNGCDYGPDTAGTATCGIQEAINSLPASIARNYATTTSVASVSGVVLLALGVFRTTRPILIPPYSRVTIQGAGRSTWSSIKTVSPYEFSGGSTVVGNCISAQGFHMGVMHCLTADPQSGAFAATTTQSGSVAAWNGEAGDTLTYSGTVPSSGWISIPLTNGGQAIVAVGFNNGAGTLSYLNVMAIYSPDGSYSTTGSFANGAPIRLYSVAQNGTYDVGYHGGGYCLSHVNLRDFDIRSISPAAPQSGSNSALGYFLPSILDISGIDIGEVANLTVIEVASTGNIRSYIGTACVNYNGGANGDMKNLRNLDVGGCHYGFSLGSSHMTADVLTSAGQAYDANSAGFNILGNLGNVWRNLQVHSSNNGLKFTNYAYGFPTTVIDGFHFENVTNYMYMTDAGKGTLAIRNPAWNSAADPQTNIAARTQNTLIVTSEENGDGGAQPQHYKPVAYNFTAGAAGPGWWPTVGTVSPLVVPGLMVGQTWKVTTPNTISQIAINGEPLFPAAPTNAAVVFVPAGDTLTITYSGAAPVFRVIPQ